MVSRNFIRVKVMEAIYAYQLSGRKDISSAEIQLEHGMDEFYALYVKLISLFPVLAHISVKVLEQKKSRLLPSEEDLCPNFKFSENVFIHQIDSNKSIEKAVKDYAVDWINDLDMLFVKPLYFQLVETDFFRQYMKDENRSYEQDKQLVLDILENFLLENEECIHYMENIHLHWGQDYNDAIILVYKTLKKYSENQSENKSLPSLFKKTSDSNVSEDKIFMKDLFHKTLANNGEFEKTIEKCLRNWDMERIATLDMLLIKMAMCEFICMPSIPTRVTLNEYIELAKYYSTPKSHTFINGVLDNILASLRSENKLQKQGRGLMG